MHHAIEERTHWRERATVSVAEAAEIAGHSTTWVRNRLTGGSLEADPDIVGPVAIKVESLAQLVDRKSAQRRRRTLCPPSAPMAQN